MELASSRYSVRSFSQKPIEKEKLELILKAAQVAPTAVNYQPHKLYVAESDKARTRLSLVRNMFGAPVSIIVCYDKNSSWKNSKDNGHDSGEVDASIVTTHMMLQAWELGIGSCWIGSFSPAEISSVFNIPDKEIPIAILALGYPSEDCTPSERHPVRKDIDEFTKYL